MEFGDRRTSSEWARTIAAQRKSKEKCCPVCGNQFTTIGRGVYDSGTCKSKAAYLRRRVVSTEQNQTLPPLTESQIPFVDKLSSLFKEGSLTAAQTEFVQRFILASTSALIQTVNKEQKVPSNLIAVIKLL